ncbi:MAG TPA: hemerythrin domain-containing protein [Kofleriaceae bacterium]|nr:hemerythrin domain-containing protein [Kofleriaceae bacterium]
MDALTLLKEQHDEVDELFAKLEKTDDSGEKAELFAELADKLAAHAKIEEVHFYPAVLAAKTKDLVIESTEEHLAIKRVLADLLEMDVDDEHFDAKLKVMKEEVTHHAREEEEGELFPKVKKLLDSDTLEALGGEMTSMFEELLEEEPRRDVPAEIAQAAQL